MPSKLRPVSFVVFLALGCTQSSTEAPSAETGDSGSTTASTSDSGDPTGNAADDDSAPTTMSSEASGSSGDPGSTGDETGSCDDACASGPPVMAWLTETEQQQGDGWCTALTDDGAGGAIAAFSGAGWDVLLSELIAVSASGEETARSAGDSGHFPSLHARGDGVFEWVSVGGQYGLADESLATLGGEPFASDVAYLHAMAADGARRGYVVEAYSAFPFLENCSLRIYADVELHSPLFECPQYLGGWRLHFDGQGQAILALEGAYQLIAFGLDALPTAELHDRWNRIIYDSAVAPDGSVWLVGAIGNETGDAYGGFVAKHGPDLSDEPIWEGLEQDANGHRFDTIAMQGDAPVVVSRDAGGDLELRGFEPNGDERWREEVDAEAGTLLSRLTVDPSGDLLGCGVRITGNLNPVGTDERMPILAKWITP